MHRPALPHRHLELHGKPRAGRTATASSTSPAARSLRRGAGSSRPWQRPPSGPTSPLSVQLHNVKRVGRHLAIADCGAAVVAYGERIKTDKAYETAKLSEALRALPDRGLKTRRRSRLELGIMDLEAGAVERVTSVAI